MPIRPQEIDPLLQQAIKDWMGQLFAQTAVLEPSAARIRSAGSQKWREAAKKHAYHFWAGLGFFVAGLGAVPIVEPASEGWAVLTLLSGMAVGVGLVIRGFVKAQQELTRFVNADMLRAVAAHVSHSQTERLYCEAVASLIDAEPVLTPATRSEILHQLNELLSSYRKLDGPMRQYLAAGGNTPVEDLERELAGLTQRRDAKVDPTARATMEQSITLCDQRLAAARALGPAREQAEAQQELIFQAMAAVQESLARMVATGSVTVDAHVVGLQNTVSQVNLQTRAVEEAVSEVLSLRV